MSITGKPIAPLTPGSPEWLQTISASKVPAILGISPWQSKYSLWHLMAGNTEPWAGNKSTERGTFLETAVLSWFRAQRAEASIEAGGSYAHADNEDWTAAPDGIAYEPDGEAGIEIKTSQYSDGWGTPGTSEVPPYYLAQAAWQMVVCGFRRVYIPVLFGQPFEFRLYVVNWEDVEADIPVIVAAVVEFQTDLVLGNAPDIDGSDSTYQTIKALHPEIDGTEVAVPENMAREFLYAHAKAEAFAKYESEWKSRIADHMGAAKKATLYGQPLFTRQAKGSGKPYLVIARTLPTIESKAA